MWFHRNHEGSFLTVVLLVRDLVSVWIYEYLLKQNKWCGCDFTISGFGSNSRSSIDKIGQVTSYLSTLSISLSRNKKISPFIGINDQLERSKFLINEETTLPFKFNNIPNWLFSQSTLEITIETALRIIFLFLVSALSRNWFNHKIESWVVEVIRMISKRANWKKIDESNSVECDS